MTNFKKQILLSILFLFIVSCTNDDEDQVLQNKTFLEIYDGKGFTGNGGDEFIYFFNTTVDFLSWVELDIDEYICYSFSVGQNSIDGENYDVEITENTSTKLTFEVAYNDGTTDSYNFVKINDTQISVDGDLYSLTSEPVSRFCN